MMFYPTHQGEADTSRSRKRERSPRHQETTPIRSPRRVNTSRDDPVLSQRQTKAYVRRSQHVGEQILHASHRPMPEHTMCQISFSKEDAFIFNHPHSDALVITAPIATIKVHRIMVDIWDYASIMYLSIFRKMKIDIKEV
ncbi:Unknown protein [Striga hermonthica]|uniref:Uncharacterized protein n=1 Tax=Striga hermonthica TaxID=68872 RepID=A0A9N7RR32_STRHE|nr:Unknown protein [Striga hermonthica]